MFTVTLPSDIHHHNVIKYAVEGFGRVADVGSTTFDITIKRKDLFNEDSEWQAEFNFRSGWMNDDFDSSYALQGMEAAIRHARQYMAELERTNFAEIEEQFQDTLAEKNREREARRAERDRKIKADPALGAKQAKEMVAEIVGAIRKDAEQEDLQTTVVEWYNRGDDEVNFYTFRLLGGRVMIEDAYGTKVSRHLVEMNLGESSAARLQSSVNYFARKGVIKLGGAA